MPEPASRVAALTIVPLAALGAGAGGGYKVGELKIRQLRAYAEKELGKGFDLRAFHDQLLARGALPLDLLEASIREWVRLRGASGAPPG